MRKLSRKFHFFLRFCTRKRSETYILKLCCIPYTTDNCSQNETQPWQICQHCPYCFICEKLDSIQSGSTFKQNESEYKSDKNAFQLDTYRPLVATTRYQYRPWHTYPPPPCPGKSSPSVKTFITFSQLLLWGGGVKMPLDLLPPLKVILLSFRLYSV